MAFSRYIWPANYCAKISAAFWHGARGIVLVGWVEYAEVERLRARHGFSERTMQSAKAALDLKMVQLGKKENRRTLWYRAELSKDDVISDYSNQHEQLRVEGF